MRTFAERRDFTLQGKTSAPTVSGAKPAGHSIFELQRTIGNRAVGELLRANEGEAASSVAYGERDENGVAANADKLVVRAGSSNGKSLPADLRGRFESSLGADLAAVRIHTGKESAEAAAALNAKAYTLGSDIYFGAGYYSPIDAAGIHLLAHEVAHTVQQRGAVPARQDKLQVSKPFDASELEAERAADAMVAGVPKSRSLTDE
jgi:Domain of unknown function (DUF4157)